VLSRRFKSTLTMRSYTTVSLASGVRVKVLTSHGESPKMDQTSDGPNLLAMFKNHLDNIHEDIGGSFVQGKNLGIERKGHMACSGNDWVNELLVSGLFGGTY
jgi:hypothetical protein